MKNINFANELSQRNLRDTVRDAADSKVLIKYDIFKMIDKNEHLFIKYAQTKLVENKTFVMERAQKIKKASRSENIAT